MSTEDNKKNPKVSTEDNKKKSKHASWAKCRDPKLQEYYTDERIESLLTENLYLKNQLKRLHPILKMFSHYPKVAEYLQQYNVK